jgi:negative regulator of replication initiation
VKRLNEKIISVSFKIQKKSVDRTFLILNVFYFNLKIGFIDMFHVLHLQNGNKIAEFLTEKFLGRKVI